MAKGWKYKGAALLLACSVAATSAAPAPAATGAAPKTATFKVGSVAFEMPMPEGFCLPAGPQTAAVDLMSQADAQNVTDLALFPCTSGGSGAAAGVGHEYIVIKTPKTMVDSDLTRDEMLKQLGAAFDNPGFKEGMAIGRAEANKALQAKSGQKIDVVGEVGPRGRDDVCAYIGGSPDVKGPAGTIRLSMGLCLTVVGSRFVTLVVCAPDSDGSHVAALMARARRLVETIRRTS